MTLDLDRVKKSPLGRAWLSVFVRRVWDSLGPLSKARLIRGVRTHRWAGGRACSMRAPCRQDDLDADTLLTGHGLLDGFWLTPLGAEVYLYGRREAGKREQPAPRESGFACSGPMGGPGAWPMRRRA